MIKRGMIYFLMLILCLSLASAAFEFNGTVRDEFGTALNNTNVTILVEDASFAQVWYNTTQTNASGWFNFSTILNNSAYTYTLSMYRDNGTRVDYVGQSLPAIPYSQFTPLVDNTYYLVEAGTMNITAANATTFTTFAVQVTDTELGYPISTCTTLSTNKQTTCYVPKDKNYSIMIYPNSGGESNFVPLSFEWNNFTATETYNITTNNLSYYDFATTTLHKQFSVVEQGARIRGYINNSIVTGWDEFRIIPYVMESGNIISPTYGALPSNTSAWFTYWETDAYNLTDGYYNITLPFVTDETTQYILFATARNGSSFYGGYRNITVTQNITNFNFTMYGLIGSNSTINQSTSDGSSLIINTTEQTFNFVNETNGTVNASANIEVTVDYSNYGSIEFTQRIETSNAYDFKLPLLNVTGLKEINVYSQFYAPRRVGTKTAAQIPTNNNITLRPMNETSGGIGSTIATSSITINMYISNSTCDVPNPSSACNIGSSDTFATFNPLKAIFGGGKISFRMTYNNIAIHYANVNMLASGPPDGMFNSAVNTSASTATSFAAIQKFGSNGPKIYSFVLVSIPYSEAHATGLNDSRAVTMSIPYLYNEDSWTTPIWNVTTNGTSSALLAANYSHYSSATSAWAVLMNSTTCTTTVAATSFNVTNPCYIDRTNNKIWVRLPHFSGTQPTITGSIMNTTAATTTSATSSSSSSGSTTTEEEEEEDNTLETTESELPEEVTTLETNTDWTENGEITTTVKEGDLFEFTFTTTDENSTEIEEAHSIIINEITEDSITLTIYSDPQEITLSLGESKSVDLNADETNDILITLHSIEDGQADITIKKTGDWAEATEEGFTMTWWLWTIIAIAAVLVIIGFFFLFRRKKKK